MTTCTRLFSHGLVICLLFATSTSAAPFANGSFEDPAQGGPTRVSISNLSDWSASGGFMLLERGVNGTSNLAAADGSQFVSFGHNGQTGDTLSQVFDTVIGQGYSVTHQLTSIQGSAPQTMSVSAFDDVSNSLLGTVNSMASLSNTWIAGTPLSFVATSASTRLEFQHTVGASGPNLALDDVRVIPEPSSLALLTAGGLLLLRRRRT